MASRDTTGGKVQRDRKLKDHEVYEILFSNLQYQFLAHLYDISPATIGEIKRGEKYKHVHRELRGIRTVHGNFEQSKERVYYYDDNLHHQLHISIDDLLLTFDKVSGKFKGFQTNINLVGTPITYKRFITLLISNKILK